MQALIQGKYAERYRKITNKILIQLRGCDFLNDSITVYNREIFLTSFEGIKLTKLWQEAPDQVRIQIVSLVNHLNLY